MFSFSLTRTEPKGQNSQTWMLKRFQVSTQDSSFLPSPCQGLVFGSFCRVSFAEEVPLKLQRGHTTCSHLQEPVCPVKGVTVGSKGSTESLGRQIFLECLAS